jgi:3-oxoacyl-ACP reductase-like protein
MSSKNISNFESCKNADDVFIKAGELYNLLFTKEEKIRIEEMESQKEIEDEFQKRLLAVDLDKFFLYL